MKASVSAAERRWKAALGHVSSRPPTVRCWADEQGTQTLSAKAALGWAETPPCATGTVFQSRERTGDLGLYGRKWKKRYLRSWEGEHGDVQLHLKAGGGIQTQWAQERRGRGYHRDPHAAIQWLPSTAQPGNPAAREAGGFEGWGSLGCHFTEVRNVKVGESSLSRA